MKGINLMSKHKKIRNFLELLFTNDIFPAEVICYLENVDNTLECIASQYLGIQTLKTQNADALDIHDVPVWQLKAALHEAYQAGFNASEKGKQK